MKRLLQLIGIRKWSGEDLISLQEEPLKTIDAFFAEYGNSIFNGCEVTAAGDAYNIAPGLVALRGKDQDNRNAFKVAPFTGLENTSLPIYLTLAYNVIEKEYVDGKVKPTAYDYYATATSIRPADETPYLEITATGGRRFIDAIGITQKLDKTGNGKDVTVTFAQAADRTNVQTGDKLATILGKIARWFTDLKGVAFTGKAADLTEDETHRFTTDTEKAGWSDKYTKQETDTKDTATLTAAKGYTDTLGNDVLRKAESYTRSEIDTKDTVTLEAAKQYVLARIAEIISGSPAALDTLYEIANALGNDPNFATTIMALINGKAPLVHTHTRAQITDFPASMPASDVYPWAKAANKPTYTAAEVGAAPSGHNHAGTYAPANHNHTGVYQPAGNYAASNHNHTGVYQPAGSYAAANHGHSASTITEETNKRFMTDAERSKLAGIETKYLYPIDTLFEDYNKALESGKYNVLNHDSVKNKPGYLNVSICILEVISANQHTIQNITVYTPLITSKCYTRSGLNGIWGPWFLK